MTKHHPKRGMTHKQTLHAIRNSTAWPQLHSNVTPRSSSYLSDHMQHLHLNTSNPLSMLQFHWYTARSSWHFHFMPSTILHHLFQVDLSPWQLDISGHICVEWDTHSMEWLRNLYEVVEHPKMWCICKLWLNYTWYQDISCNGNDWIYNYGHYHRISSNSSNHTHSLIQNINISHTTSPKFWQFTCSMVSRIMPSGWGNAIIIVCHSIRHGNSLYHHHYQPVHTHATCPMPSPLNSRQSNCCDPHKVQWTMNGKIYTLAVQLSHGMQPW